MNQEQCRSCRAPVEWRQTVNGKWMPYDVAPDGHNVISHFATCPEAAKWRKRKPGEGAEAEARANADPTHLVGCRICEALRALTDEPVPRPNCICGHARGSHTIVVTKTPPGPNDWAATRCLSWQCVCDRYIPEEDD